MSNVGQRERATQQRVIQLLTQQLGYTYLGNWHDQDNKNIIEADLGHWLHRRGINDSLINRAVRELDRAAALGEGQNLYDANKAVYRLLRYGVKVKAGAGEQNQTVWLIDWQHPENNVFAVAEEVSIRGENKKRPDLVLYVNGIALGVIELKRASVSVTEGIRQNLDNQKKAFIRSFFSTLQLVMAGNDTEGLRYGTIETPEKHYLSWKEENPDYDAQRHERHEKYLPGDVCDDNFGCGNNPLDVALLRLLNKPRFLELLHDFIVFDAGVKKTCRHNQYFGVKAAQNFVRRKDGGIIWHTQGSGKSLSMVWLAKWIRENVTDARVLVITDRTELDQQIEGVFLGVDEEIYRTQSGADLIAQLNQSTPWLLCSLIHKFGRSQSDDEEGIATKDFLEDLQKNLPSNFKAKGQLFVFVDECHRTQSGLLHKAMKAILPGATFIGFTGTPLLRADKQKSVEVFGPYIHAYKFDEAVSDGVVLDLRYEARDIDQNISSQQRIDQWFEAKTRELTDVAKVQLKQKWGTLKKVLSSKSRLEKIANDILLDMETKPGLMDGRGNAMLVCSSIYEACTIYDIFCQAGFAEKCAIVTSYKPSPADIKGEESGEGLTEKLRQYDIYRKMLADFFDIDEDSAMNKVEDFEKKVKQRFIKEPGQMRLLIVVDKLLTGFDAPSATYLYIDKQMRDHNLFQAICRVNRLDGDDKDYGYIIDYKDLFHQLEGAISDYTVGAFDGYDKADVQGLLTNRLAKASDKLEEVRESIKALCEPVMLPRNIQDYLHYFCAADTRDNNALKENEPKRVALYKLTSALMRAYANIANEMHEAGYSDAEIQIVKNEVRHYDEVRNAVKMSSGDYVDMKLYEPAMRRLIDSYIRAEDSEIVSEFEDLGLIELIVENADQAIDQLPKGIKGDKEAVAETIENNMRKVITEEKPVNPKYYERMSELLDALILERREQALEYAEYLKKIQALAKQVSQPEQSTGHTYPASIDTHAKRALYDNLDNDEVLANKIDTAVRYTKKDGWVGNHFKERELAYAVRQELGNKADKLPEVMELLKNQGEYR